MKTQNIVFVSFALLMMSCGPGVVDADAGMLDADAGMAGLDDGGSAAQLPEFEVDEGFFGESEVHDAPAMCGQAPFKWWGTDALGAVVDTNALPGFTTSDLGGFISLMSMGGFASIQRTPQHDTNLEQVRYVTQDRGFLIETSGLIATPATPGTYPMVLYTHGTMGFSQGCAPSNVPAGAIPGQDNFQQWIHGRTVALLASMGFVVVAPDYIGLEGLGGAADAHPYLVGQPTAIASLDAVRAASNHLAGSDILTEGLHVMGASQGGHAAAFSVRYAPHYAPELDLRSAVYSIPPLDLDAHANGVLSVTDPRRLGNAVATSIASDAWYDSADSINDIVKDPHVDNIRTQMQSVCGSATIDGATGVDVVTDEAVDDSFPETWDCYQKENSLNRSSIPDALDLPTLVVFGQNDVLVPPSIEKATVQELCEDGENIEIVECAGAGHVQGALWSLDNILGFFEARLAGEPIADSCIIPAATTCLSQP